MAQQYKLPELKYALSDLEPVISGQIMDLHYNKHHQTYITNLNNALAAHVQATSEGNLVKHLELQQVIKFNAGGHVNHTLFWENLTPTTNSSVSNSPMLQSALKQRFGDFQAEFEGVALGLQGSGWVWLVKDVKSGGLDIVTSKDQDIVPMGKVPIIGVDMWEHAYYLQYLNNKKSYVQGIWSVINWKVAESRFVGTQEDIFGELLGLASKL